VSEKPDDEYLPDELALILKFTRIKAMHDAFLSALSDANFSLLECAQVAGGVLLYIFLELKNKKGKEVTGELFDNIMGSMKTTMMMSTEEVKQDIYKHLKELGVSFVDPSNN
jgi:hypothetical protein